MPSLPLQTLHVQLRLAETKEIFSLLQCQNVTVKTLKSHLELLTGIPLHLQGLQYLDEAHLGVTGDSTPHVELPGPEQKKERVAHGAFASHRGHVETAKFLPRRVNESSQCENDGSAWLRQS
ncbi:LOW QUALITY PROTEIN: ankyrin repeat domain-containing protein 60 [Cariama cristata]